MSPPNYLPFPTRLIVILHLSFAFALVCCQGLSPFFEEHWELKSQLLLYQNAMGKLETTDPAFQEKLSRHATRFSQLPNWQREVILNGYQKLTEAPTRTWSDKMQTGIQNVLFGIPAFAQGWIFFSVLICILLLLRIEGASKAAWLLPLLTSFYCFYNVRDGAPPPLRAHQQLIPTESYIIERYLGGNLEGSITEQREQLFRGWQQFLINEWSQAPAKQDPELQAEDGEFYFILAQIQAIKAETKLPAQLHQIRESAFFYMMYMAWNLFFAWFVNRKEALDLA